MNRLTRTAVLVGLWLLAWGDVTLVNVISGTAVATALLLAFPPTPDEMRHHFRVNVPGALRLAGYVVIQLVTSNVVMTREILRPQSRIRPGVLAHRLECPSDELVTLMTSVIALSPGTMTADVDPDSTTIYVHFLLLNDVDAARKQLGRLERLASQALVRKETA